jgi:hypothetical protein
MFRWEPRTFKDAVRLVTSHPDQFRDAVMVLVRNMKEVACPAPPWDPDGLYRVVVKVDKPVIEKRTDSGQWQPASLTPAAGAIYKSVEIESLGKDFVTVRGLASAGTLTARWSKSGNSFTVQVTATEGQFDMMDEPFHFKVVGEWEFGEFVDLLQLVDWKSSHG